MIRHAGMSHVLELIKERVAQAVSIIPESVKLDFWIIKWFENALLNKFNITQ